MLKRLSFLALPLILVGFLAGLGRFLYLRFSAGDVYPAYSSLRTDPVGTKALYESLGRLSAFTAARQFEPLRKISADSQSTLLFLGLQPGSIWDAQQEFTELARSGARVVLAFDARSSLPHSRESDRINAGPKPRITNNIPGSASEKPLNAFSGLRLQLIDPLKRDTNVFEARCTLDPAPRDIPWSLPWYGHYWLDGASNNWETVYAIKDNPVVLRRKMGLGSIILLADSFAFSNEALATRRSPEFLLWAIGPAATVLFDETHLGVERGSSIAVLLREYRMHGLLAGLLLLAGLWIWKNSSSFVPAYSDESGVTEDNSVVGKTAREGIHHLLQRNIALQDLPAVCVQEWAKANANAAPAKLSRLKDVEPVLAAYKNLPSRDRNPIETYRIIADILSPKKS